MTKISKEKRIPVSFKKVWLIKLTKTTHDFKIFNIFQIPVD